MFGNIYLNDFDHFAMRLQPDVRYGRYVDDMFFVGKEKAVLTALVPRVRAYLNDELALALHPRKLSLQHYRKGFDFLGVSIRQGCIYPRHRLKGNMYRAIARWNARAAERDRPLDEREVDSLVASLNSYLGGMVAYRTRRLRRRMLERLSRALDAYLIRDARYRFVRKQPVGKASGNTQVDRVADVKTFGFSVRRLKD
jgi:hypothetical protein